MGKDDQGVMTIIGAAAAALGGVALAIILSRPPVPPSESKLSISLSEDPLLGEANMIDVQLTIGAQTLPGQEVTIDILRPDNTHYTAGYTTDANGAVRIEWTCTHLGKHTVTATFAGSEGYEPATATSSFVVADTPPVIPTAATVAGNGSTYTLTTSKGTTTYSTAQAAINAAIASLPSRTSKVRIKLNGTFRTTGATSPLPAYTLVELAPDAVLTQAANAPVWHSANADNIEIAGGTYLGAYKQWNREYATFHFEKCHYLDIHDLVHGNPVVTQEGGGFKFCCIYDCGYITLYNLTVRNGGTSGDIYPARGWYAGSFHTGTLHDCEVYNCEFNNNRAGLYFYCHDDDTKQVIQRVHIHDNDFIGGPNGPFDSGVTLSTRGDEDEAVDCTIECNRVYNCGTDGDHPGINIGYSSGGDVNALAHGCKVRYNEVWTDLTEHSYWKDRDWREDGTGTIVGNGYCGNGIAIQGYDNDIHDNYVHDIYDVGILVRGLVQTGNLIYHNTIHNAAQGPIYYSGIYIWTASNNYVYDNEICNSNGIRQPESTGNKIGIKPDGTAAPNNITAGPCVEPDITGWPCVPPV